MKIKIRVTLLKIGMKTHTKRGMTASVLSAIDAWKPQTKQVDIEISIRICVKLSFARVKKSCSCCFSDTNSLRLADCTIVPKNST